MLFCMSELDELVVRGCGCSVVSPISLYLVALPRHLTYCWASYVYGALVAALKTTFIYDCGVRHRHVAAACWQWVSKYFII